MKFKAQPGKVYIVPTRFGIVFAFLTLTLLLIGGIYGNNLVYLLSFLLVAIGLLAMTQTHHNIKGVSLAKLNLPPLPAGKSASVEAVLANDKSESQFSVDIELKTAGESFTKRVNEINAHSSQRGPVFLEIKKRGIYSVEKLKISTRFPLGLFYAWKVITCDEKVYVYPKPLGSGELPLGDTSSTEAKNSWATGSEEFSEQRLYRTGDSFRRIDWKSYSKRQVLLTKQYQEEVGPIVDMRWNSVSGSDEERLSQLSLWLERLKNSGRSFRLQIPGDELEIGNGERHREIGLKKLASFGRPN